MLMFPPQGKFAADDKAYWSTKGEEAGLSLSAAFTIVLFGDVFHTFTQSSGAGNSDHTTMLPHAWLDVMLAIDPITLSAIATACPPGTGRLEY